MRERSRARKSRQATLLLQIADAEKLLTDSAGKTLDEVARTALTNAISKARFQLAQQQESGRQFAAALTLAERVPGDATLWPPDQLAAAAATEAQAAADKAAAEEAERLARARTITSASTVTESGGATAPSAPAAPVVPIAPVVGFDIEGYVLALAPNSFISWGDALCSGYYVGGRAWVGGVKTTPGKIERDPALRDIYANRIGISVLVHESAHARQWLYYGADIISANEALTGLVGAPALEYMADCATIGKLGYSTGTYTNSCTADQLDAADLIW